MPDSLSPLMMALTCMGLSSLASLTQLLRSGKPLHLRYVISTCLSSGLFGLIIFLLAYTSLGQHWYYILAVSILAGMGGQNILEFVITAWGRGGITVVIKPKDEENDDASS